MGEDRTVVYISSLLSEEQDIALQEYFCRKYCKENNLTNIEVCVETGKENTILKKIFSNLSKYTHLVTYNICTFGNRHSDILHYIDTILETETEFICILFPINKGMLSYFSGPTQAFVKTTLISSAIDFNDTMKEVMGYKLKFIS